ncbi:MAG: glycosyltransferase family 1 protein, partial [Actinobacteria bacterium]|nr:glycosyltransferase family 1 protein [Actinomycetota bacterium]
PAHTDGGGVALASPSNESIWAGGADLAREVNALVRASSADVVVLLGPGTEPLHDGWLARLAAAAADDDVVAATPLVLHPERPLREATPHDLLVRAAGLRVEVVGGAPVAVARHAGEPPNLAAAPEDVDAAPATAVAVARSAWMAVGGLGSSADLDAAVFDLCTRLRRHGAIRAVAGSVVADHAPVRSAADLAGPLAPDGLAWRRLVDAHGPALVRATGAVPPGTWTVSVTTAAPSRKVASVSGDWHYAGLFAAALARAGHRARVCSIEEANDPAERACDLRVVLRGLEPVRRTAGQRHVLWVISHPEALEAEECDAADLVVVASHRYAAHLRTLTDTPVEVLLQATDPAHFRPVTPSLAHHHRVAVVANTRGFSRPAVADALAGGLGPAVHGTGWEGLVPPGVVCADYVPFDELPTVYASAEVVLNDHWETMRRWGFLSNRLFDVLACGTPVVSDDLPEVAEVFGELVPTWETPGQLRDVVVGLLADPRGTAARVAEARELVLASHTMDHRVAELTELLERHELVPGDGAGPTR